MPLSELDILKKENKSILDEYAKVSDLCKNLIFEIQKRDNHINTLEHEKKMIMEELNLLKNHNKELALKLNNHGIHGEVKPDSKANETLEYLLSRSQSKTAVRVTSLKKNNPKICMISSLPKSGTWSMQYFWAVFDSLCKGSKEYDPYDPFFLELDGIGIDLFAIAHFYCPEYNYYVPEDYREKLASLKYPAAPGYDWGNEYLRDNGLATHCDLLKNKNVKIVFMYRNPLDQLVSYGRAWWMYDQKIAPRPRSIMQDKNGNLIQVDTFKQFIRTGGATSYVYYFFTYHIMKNILGDDLLFVRYEDVFRNRYTKLREIGNFFLGSIDNGAYKDPFDKAVDLTKIENMKLLESVTPKAITHHYLNPKPGGIRHVFDGSIGKWKRYFDQDDIDYVFGLLDNLGIGKDYFVFD
ncbi:MAG: hypothetical protein E3K36_04095 [Candidatus Brocadia sp.]|nr:hypothetical protein [Candidatus Brocadia sp.]